MSREPSEFRERLLGAQAMTAGLREEHRRELDALLHPRLTKRSRLLAWAGLIASLVFAAACIWSLAAHHDKPQVKWVLPSYAAVFIGTAAYLAQVLRSGVFSRRASFAAVEWLGGILVGVYLTATLFHGMKAPSDPASTLGAVWGLMLLSVGFAWGTGNRIAAATLETREHLLRIESRLAELAEKMK
jgi:hypothetical protein